MGNSKSTSVINNIPLVLPVTHLMKPVKLLKGDSSLNSPCFTCNLAIHESTQHIFITDQTPFGRISIFTSSFNFITTFKHPNMISPYGIAVQNNIISVVDRGVCVLSFEEEEIGFCKVQVQSSFDILNYYYGLCGTTLSRDGTRIYIAQQLANRIIVLRSSDLSLIHYISHPTLTNPVNVQICDEELYVLGLDNDKAVHIFSQNGEKLRSIIIQRISGYQVLSSRFFCINSHKVIFITDSNCKMTKAFSNQGEHLYSLSGLGYIDGMNAFSKGVAVNSESNIVFTYMNGLCEISKM